jgi:hypothetical protein
VCGRISFSVGLIQQQLGPGLDIREPHVLIFEIFAVVLDVVVEDGEVVVMGAVVDDCVFGGVADGQQVQRLLLVLQEQLDLLQLPRGEHELLLVFILRHQIIITSQRSPNIFKPPTVFQANRDRGKQQ